VKKKPQIIERKLGRERIEKEKVVGLAHFEENLIEVDPRQSAKDYFDTVIHERLHFLFPDMKERKIGARSKELSHFLWMMGYRRVYLK